MQLGRVVLQNAVNRLHNVGLQNTPQNVNGALPALTNGQLDLESAGAEAAMLRSSGDARGDWARGPAAGGASRRR